MAEAKREGPTWKERLEWAAQVGWTTREDAERADQWTQCAVGEQQELGGLEFDIHGLLLKKHRLLWQLGIDFSFCVKQACERIEVGEEAKPAHRATMIAEAKVLYAKIVDYTEENGLIEVNRGREEGDDE